MNILLLGAGGREHAFAQKISKSVHCEKLFIAPGNPGTAQFGENIAMGVNDFKAIGAFCTAKNIQMLVVGPEDPLVNGIFDYFKSGGLIIDLIATAPLYLLENKNFAVFKLIRLIRLPRFYIVS